MSTTLPPIEGLDTIHDSSPSEEPQKLERNMDRERLKDVQTSDLTDDRLNEDFVVWLKTKGPSWLLIILLAVVAYLYIVNWQQGKVNYRNEAWIALLESQTPAAFEDVAVQYPDVDSIAQQARLRAAGMYLQSAVLGRAIGSTEQDPVELAAEDRTFNLERAAALYQEILSLDSGALDTVVVTYTAMNGLAAIAECNGDLDAAAEWYEKAATRASGHFPYLAERARMRGSGSASYDRLVEIPESLPEPETLESLNVGTDVPAPQSIDDVTSIITLPEVPAPSIPGKAPEEDEDSGLEP